MPKRKFDITIGAIAVLALFVLGALFLGSNSFRDLMEARRRAAEGWDIVSVGSFVPLNLKQVGTEDANIFLNDYLQGATPDIGALMFFRARAPFPNSDLTMGEKKALASSYAKIVTPKGSYLLVPIERNGIDPNLCVVQIPALQPSDTRSLELHLVAPGCMETVIRIDKPPVTEDTVPQRGPLVTEVKDSGIEIKGEAFAAYGPGSSEQTGIGYRLRWSNLPSDLLWRMTLSSGYSKPFIRPNYEQKSFETGSSELEKTHSLGMIESIPYAPEIDKIKVNTTLEGFSVQEEVVDFGPMKFFQEASRMTRPGSPAYCFDFDKPISKKLSNGLTLTLLPLRSLRNNNSFIGGEGLYFRLKIEPETKEARIEAKLLGAMDYYTQISPEMNPGRKPELSNMVMLWWKHPKTNVLPLKFSIRKLISQRKVPIELRLPVDRSKPRKSTMTDHTLQRGTEFIN